MTDFIQALAVVGLILMIASTAIVIYEAFFLEEVKKK